MIGNKINEILFDTVTFAASAVAASTPYKLFKTLADGSTKFDSDTNQTKQGVCPYTWMRIKGIYAYCKTNSVTVLPTQADVHKILKNCTLTIKKKTVPVLERPIIKLGPGGGIDGYSSNTNTGALGIALSGMPLVTNMYVVGLSENDGITKEGLEFVKDELLDVTLTAEKTFTPAAETKLEIGFFCEIIDDLG